MNTEVARKLFVNNDQMYYREIAVDIEGASATFPYRHLIFAAYNEIVDPDEYENFILLSDFFETGKLPTAWKDFILKIWEEKKAHGSEYPVDLLSGVFFVTHEHPRVSELRIPQFDSLSTGMRDFRDFKKVNKIVDGVMNDPVLCDYLRKTLLYLIPDRSDGWLDREAVLRWLVKLGINSGLFLDMGCGVGQNVEFWKRSGLNPIGMERQFHRPWYERHWNNGATFVRSDIRHMPMSNESVSVAVAEYVLPYANEMAILKIVGEVTRTLKDKGVFIVGPQNETDDHSGWRVLQKIQGELKVIN